MKIKNISIFIRPNAGNDLKLVLKNLVNWLSRQKRHVFLHEKNADSKKFEKLLSNKSHLKVTNDPKELFESDLIISLGGDGTLLGVCRGTTRKSPPILGVNLGKLGFITEYSRHEFFDQLPLILKGKCKTRKLSLFTAEVFHKNKIVFKGSFINDAVFNQSDISRMITLSVESDGENIYTLSGDGLILSSSTGSTAYSLAAGGPIIHPDVNGLVLTPICPHGLNHRPIVLSHKREFQVTTPRGQDPINLTLDGQVFVPIESGARIVIKRNNSQTIKIIENSNRTYFDTLKEKFTYGRK